jgi:antitoxin component of MazEF toxin-antitoxin module
MRKTLTTIGTDVALVLDPALRGALGLKRDQSVEVQVDGDSLVVHRCDEPSEVDPVTTAFQQIVENPECIRQGPARPHGVEHLAG